MKNRRRTHELISRMNFERIEDFAKDKPTPCLIVDLDTVDRLYTELENSMPNARIFYAMKACPEDDVIKLIASRGGNFDAASRYEIDQLLSLGITGDRISYGNTIKKECDIEYAYKHGIRLFTTDADSDIEKIAKVAPGSKVNFRILVECAGSDWPLGEKFGCHQTMAYDLAIKAKELGLIPYGISFHVGSQQRQVDQWSSALSQVKTLMDHLKKVGIKLQCINLGGGFPADYMEPTRSTRKYGETITAFLKDYFGNSKLDIITEPGRSLTANAGVISTDVVMVSKKSRDADVRWVYLNIGRFSGLPETQDEAIKYPILFPHSYEENTPYGPIILAGNTCDSADVMYKDDKYHASLKLKDGDRCYILSTGSYTASYSAINFNGFPPLKTYVIPRTK